MPATDAPAPQRMPALFVGHGSPMIAITDNPFRPAWEALGRSLPRPEAILCVSAHWYTRGTRVAVTPTPETIHDFYGFPDALHALRYDAPGAPGVARRAAAMLAPRPVAEDDHWGLDHGAWCVLRSLFPAADVPVFQLSVDGLAPARQHLEIGRALRPLRDEGVMLVASGNIVHNLGAIRREASAPLAWNEAFDRYVADALERNDDDALVHFERAGASAALAVPTPDHYLPLLYAQGMRTAHDGLRFFATGYDIAAIAMRGVIFE
ncbi:MAG: 4,5-DOPA dioxygenase extradiol [Burkholderiaceae bacterium]|nr:4,5-DOPA dioxygenase extradiol [Burkholderiaceae bacterium]